MTRSSVQPAQNAAAAGTPRRFYPGTDLALCLERGWGPGTMIQGRTKHSWSLLEIRGFDADGGAIVIDWTADSRDTSPHYHPLHYRAWEPVGDPVPFPDAKEAARVV